MMAASMGLKAQEITITLWPKGWTWITYPNAEVMDIATALGDFVPMQGDIIKSQYSQTAYINGRWMGHFQQFTPGIGYMYYSNRTEAATLAFGTPAPQFTVSTSTPTDITTLSAVCGGEVGDSGDYDVVVRGVCWSTQPNPTIADPHTTDSYGIGNFTSLIEGLNINTTYFVRAYALTVNGTCYGEQKVFTTKDGVPLLTTLAPSEVGTTWAFCGGDVIDDGSIEVTERGICWSTSHNPTIEGNHGANGAGLGSFTVNMYYLEPNTIYYVRTYAINSHTTAYGNEISFRTEATQTWPNGMLPGEFSVSATQKVRFSQGNLQYIGSCYMPYWRFAEHQWDFFGTTTGQNSSYENIDRDLFGWGTSGYDNGANCYQPWSTSTNCGDYYVYGNYAYDLNDRTGQADWGYNPILNGGHTENNGWRTLTKAEWVYVFNTRSTSSGIRYAKAKVHGVNGVILLPNNWNTTIYTLSNPNSTQASYNSNVIADSDWTTMETYGAVFLPAAGYRTGNYVFAVGSDGYYWSASHDNSYNSFYVYFKDSNLNPQSKSVRYEGRSVRLVQVAQ